MRSLQQLLGHEDRFLDLLEASAVEGVESVKALGQLARQPQEMGHLEACSEAKRKEKVIQTKINVALCEQTITGLERADIVTLSDSLYKIPKTVEKIAERMLLAPQFLEGQDLVTHLVMLEQATTTLLKMVRGLRERASVKSIREMNEQLQRIEADADSLVLDLLKQLYGGTMEGRCVVFLKDLFELVEKVTDRCRDAGNSIVTIALKTG